MRRGDVFVVDFGEYRGSLQGGKRPAVVIGNDIGNRYSPTIFVAPLTSREKPDMCTHVKVAKGDGNLNSDGTILVEQTKLVNRDQISYHIGTLCDSTMEKVDAAIRMNFGI